MRHQRVRLLAVISGLQGGGAEQQLLMLLRHLDRAQFEPTLCLFSDQGPLRAEVPVDVPVVALGKRSRRDTAAVVARLARVIRHNGPDVILSKMEYTSMLTAAACLISGRSRPLVVAEESVQSIALQRTTYATARRLLIRWSYRRAATIVVPCWGVAADLRDNVKVRASRYDVVPNMVDIDAVHEAARQTPHLQLPENGSPLIVSVGRLVRAKGHADLIDAAAVLRSLGHPCNVVILGEGPERAALGQRAEALDLREHVILPGFVHNPFAVMARADVLVSSSHAESFGNALIEAMALGVPVVSTRVSCGPKEIINDGANGLFATPQDPRDLAEKVRALIVDPDLRTRIVASAREPLRKCYGVETVVRRYERLLTDVAAG